MKKCSNCQKYLLPFFRYTTKHSEDTGKFFCENCIIKHLEVVEERSGRARCKICHEVLSGVKYSLRYRIPNDKGYYCKKHALNIAIASSEDYSRKKKEIWVCPAFQLYNIETKPNNVVRKLKKSKISVYRWDILDVRIDKSNEDVVYFENHSSQPGTDRKSTEMSFKWILQRLKEKRKTFDAKFEQLVNVMFGAYLGVDRNGWSYGQTNIPFKLLILRTYPARSHHTRIEIDEKTKINYYISYEDYFKDIGEI